MIRKHVNIILLEFFTVSCSLQIRNFERIACLLILVPLLDTVTFIIIIRPCPKGRSYYTRDNICS